VARGIHCGASGGGGAGENHPVWQVQQARDALELYYEQFRGIALASRPDDAVPISPSPSPPPQSARLVRDLGNSSHAHQTYTVRNPGGCCFVILILKSLFPGWRLEERKDNWEATDYVPDYFAPAPSSATTPIERAPLLVCHGQQPDFVRSNGVDERVWEFDEGLLSHTSPDEGSRIRELRDALYRPLDLVDEYAAEPRVFEVIKISCFVDLDLGRLVDRE